MFERTYYATHPDMMECVSNEELRDRYLIEGLFREGECVLNYTHADRFVIGGVGGRAAARCALPDADRAGLAPPAIRSSSGASWRSSMSAGVDGHGHRRRRALRARQQGLPLRHDGREGRDLLGRGRALLSRLLPGAQGLHDAQAVDRRGQCARARQPRGIERADDLPAGHPRRLRQRAAGHGPDRAQAGQRLEHDAAAHPRAAQRDLFLLRARRRRTTASSTSWARARRCGTSWSPTRRR